MFPTRLGEVTYYNLHRRPCILGFGILKDYIEAGIRVQTWVWLNIQIWKSICKY